VIVLDRDRLAAAPADCPFLRVSSVSYRSREFRTVTDG
jgi:hypothetical protein